MLTVPDFLFAISVRVLQGLLSSAPTLLIGLFVAGVLRAMVGPRRIQQLFAGEGWAGLIRASLLATLTPVCALGVLPILRELHRAGLPTSKLLTFGLSAPMLNPITLVWGWTMLPVPVFVLLVGVTLLVSLGIGGITDRWAEAKRKIDSDEAPSAEWGLRRMANVGMAAARAATMSWCDLLICLPTAGLVAALIPYGWLPHEMSYQNPWAPLTMCLAAPTAYVDPYIGVIQVWAMASVQYSLGAAVVLHVFGVGANAAVVVWISRLYGMRRLVSLGMIVFALTLGVGYAADALLDHPPGMENETHGLDSLGRPPVLPSNSGRQSLSVIESALHNKGPAVVVLVNSFAGFAILSLVGLVLIARKTPFLEDSPETNSEKGQSAETAIWKKPIPGYGLALISLVGLLLLLVLLVYVYYPPPKDIFEEMKIVRTDAVMAINHSPDIAERELQRLDGLVAKLPISMALRGQPTTEEARQSADELRSLIQELRQRVRDGQASDADRRGSQLLDASTRCWQLHLGTDS